MTERIEHRDEEINRSLDLLIKYKYIEHKMKIKTEKYEDGSEDTFYSKEFVITPEGKKFIEMMKNKKANEKDSVIK